MSAPRIGGVGTRQSVYGTKGFLARITDMFLDHRYFDENASQSLLGRAVSCLSGRTALYRRALLMNIEAEFIHETFWGVPALSTASVPRPSSNFQFPTSPSCSPVSSWRYAAAI